MNKIKSRRIAEMNGVGYETAIREDMRRAKKHHPSSENDVSLNDLKMVSPAQKTNAVNVAPFWKSPVNILWSNLQRSNYSANTDPLPLRMNMMYMLFLWTLAYYYGYNTHYILAQAGLSGLDLTLDAMGYKSFLMGKDLRSLISNSSK